MRRTAIILFTLICLSSCNRFDIDEVLLQREDISLTMNGKEQFSYDPNTCQTAFNDAYNEYRVYDDAIGNWFILRCDAKPAAEGQTVKADLSWTASTTTRSKRNLTFTVERTDAEGHIWMWCKSDNIGVVVKDI